MIISHLPKSNSYAFLALISFLFTQKEATNSLTSESKANSSLAGSFISDTLTLNGANGHLNEIVKYKSSTKEEERENDLMIVGKALLQSKEDESGVDEKTDNDQEVLDFDDDYYDELDEKENSKIRGVDVREQRKEILNEIDNDLTTLEQLREQKKLLRSIRLRKEELKALEGRRKALEALKSIAFDGENQLEQVFDVLTKTKNQTEEKPSSNAEVDAKKVSQQQPLLRKTFKQADLNELANSMSSAKIEPTSQIEKSKKTVKHYEDMIRKNISLANENYGVNKSILNIEPSDDANDEEEELEEKKANLAENERKLEELYSMQERLSQLKDIISHFNGLKKSQSELSQLRNGSEQTAVTAQSQTDNESYETYLNEQTIAISEKINSKLSENTESGSKNNLVSNLKKENKTTPEEDELSDNEELADDELLEAHKR